MNKVLIATAVALLSCLTINANASIAIYTDRLTWEEVVGAYAEESFTDEILNPGLTVESELPGYVDTTKGVWWDSLYGPTGTGGSTTTTWRLSCPMTAWGGDWNCAGVGGPGTGIAVSIYGSGAAIGEICSTYEGGFWGFISTDPIYGVRLGTGQGSGWTESYELDNLSYNMLPEPSALIVLLAGLASTAGLARRRK